MITRNSSIGVSGSIKAFYRSAHALALVVVGLVVVPGTVHAQAPGLLWTTNVGGTVFAVDGQTNIYANANGTVITLSAEGQPFATNPICPVPSLQPEFAKLDSTGNYYFAGDFDGTNNFGGTNLVGGWINMGAIPPRWQPGYPTGFLAKYSGNGTLQWVVALGLNNGSSNWVTDLILNSDDSVTVAVVGSGISTVVEKFDSTGTSNWQYTINSQDSVIPVRLSGIVGTNGGLLQFIQASRILGLFYSPSGNLIHVNTTFLPLWNSPLSLNGKPVTTVANEMYYAGLNPTNNEPILQKYLIDGTLAWTQPIGTVEQWLLGSDSGGYLYLSGTTGIFSKYDELGDEVWTTNYSLPVTSVLVDNSNNRFLQLSDGSIAGLAADPPPVAPSISVPPPSVTVFVGDNVSLSETAIGTPPLYYQWQLNGTNLPGAANGTLTLDSVTASQSGLYTVVVTNSAGAITSTPPAVLRVKQVELYIGSQLLTNGTYTFSTPPTLTVRSAFTNGEEFYTLDGSAPDFTSNPYSGPFAVNQSATVRAIGYSDDFSQSEEADEVNIVLLKTYTLTASTAGGGTITLNPSGGTYLSTNIVTVTAVPNAGWQFLYWLGDASGSGSTAQITMNSDKTVAAVFGTTLSTTVAGNGQVLLDPAGPLYPYGATVRLTGVPTSGSYFGAWGNAASGNVNPLYFTVTNPSPTVSSIFGTLSAGQEALTVEISGHGEVNASPQGNVFSTGQKLTLTAIPDLGQRFLGWGGDASGTQILIPVTMNQSRVITASFTAAPVLRVNPQLGEGPGPDGFRFGLLGDPNSIYQIYWSSNLTQWGSLGYVTNQVSEMQVLDSAATNSPQRFYRIAP